MSAFQRRPVLFGACGLFLLLVACYSFSIGLRATRGASITGDEPFYLLTTQSLLQDGNLDLREQYMRESYRSFFDHPDGLWKQSVPMADGTLLSPHQPGLSVLLLPGFGVAGLRGAQAELVLITALTFALAFVLTAKETGRPLLSWAVTALVALTATEFVYASEVYPEMPAALCIVLALLVLRSGRNDAVGGVVMAAPLVALAWLGEKYIPLGVTLAAFWLWQASNGGRMSFLGLSAVTGVIYVWFHLAFFGEFTAYSVNTVHEGASTLNVIESHVSVTDRAYRVFGLFIDRHFGLGHWAPLFLLVLPALPLLATGRRADGQTGRVGRVVVALIVMQIGLATFMAITMMGWWFPGRTLVAVLPLFALVLTVLASRLDSPLWLGLLGLGAWSILNTVGLVMATRGGEVTLAVDPFLMDFGLFRWVAPLFPDYRSWGAETVGLTVGWLIAALLVAVALLVTQPVIAGHRRSEAKQSLTERNLRTVRQRLLRPLRVARND
jgi:hypothetical protein